MLRQLDRPGGVICLSARPVDGRGDGRLSVGTSRDRSAGTQPARSTDTLYHSRRGLSTDYTSNKHAKIPPPWSLDSFTAFLFVNLLLTIT